MNKSLSFRIKSALRKSGWGRNWEYRLRRPLIAAGLGGNSFLARDDISPLALIRSFMSDRTINEDVLRGIVAALQLHAPHLLPVIYRLMHSALPEPSSGQIGESIHGKLTGTISWDEAQPVLVALQNIERDFGYNAVFAGRQINFLVLSWRQFAEPKQLPQG